MVGSVVKVSRKQSIISTSGVTLALGTLTVADTAERPATPTSKIVTGEVRKIEGEPYVIRDQEGNEVRLVTDPNTDLQGTIKMGGQVEAEASMHAFSHKRHWSNMDLQERLVKAHPSRSAPTVWIRRIRGAG